MTELNLGRMLLSHNFQISPEVLPPLSRAEFTAVFAEGLEAQMQCQMVENPHWILEILFPQDQFTPQQVGESCARVLASKRQASSGSLEILILGGLKTTPPTSNAPTALQTGDWGVDVVETSNGEEFLRSINWTAMIADKPPSSVFCIQLSVR